MMPPALRPTFGLEEEVIVIDRMTYSPVTPHAACVSALKDRLGSRVALEYKASVLEFVTGIHDDIFALTEEAAANRFEANIILARFGYASLPLALHPSAQPLKLPAREGERYRKIERQKGDAVRNLAANGVHLHVGTFTPGDGEALKLLPTLMHLAPLHAAVSAGSPFCGGRETGQASWRQRVLMQLASGLPLAAADPNELARMSAALAAAGGPADASEHWGLVRLGAGKPTIEFRAADTTPSLDTIPWLAALTGAAVVAARMGLLRPLAVSPLGAAYLYAANLDRVAAEGSDALLIDPFDLSARSVSDTLQAWIARLEVAIDLLGFGDAISLMPKCTEAPCRAQLQLVAEAEADALERGLSQADARTAAFRRLIERALIDAASTPSMPWIRDVLAA